MGIHTPVAHGAFAEAVFQPILRLYEEFARATDAWISFLNPCALNLATLERDLDTLRPLYPVILPRFSELDTVLNLTAIRVWQDPDFAREVGVFREFLNTTSRHARGLSQEGLSAETLMPLLGQDTKKLSPESTALKKSYEDGFNFVHTIERQWFNLLCDTATEAFSPSRRKSLPVWVAALEQFFRPEERMRISFMIPQEKKPDIRRIMGLCGRCGDVCGILQAKLIVWQRDNDQPSAEPPVPSYMFGD